MSTFSSSQVAYMPESRPTIKKQPVVVSAIFISIETLDNQWYSQRNSPVTSDYVKNLQTPVIGVSPMVKYMKSTHESVSLNG